MKKDNKKTKLNFKFTPAKKIATNRDFTLAINDFGEISGWGNNKDERIFNKDVGELIENPRKYEHFMNKYLKLVEISCGNSHIAAIACNKDNAVTESGYVFTWGLDLFGRLGYVTDSRRGVVAGEEEEYKFKPIPTQVKIPERVSRICCGNDFTACITVKGQIYSWGTNKWGNLGIENTTYSSEQYVVRTPVLISSLLNKFIIQIACGSKHMMALSSDRKVYSWGSGDFGVLGHGGETGVNKPQMIKELVGDEIIFITCGEFNSGAITSTGKLYLWGNGKFGRLGVGSEENELLPKLVVDSVLQREKVFFVSIGFYHTICCTIDGKSFSWGYSENGRLGSVDKSECDQKKKMLTPREIILLKGNKISQVYAGHHHSLAISLSGKVWGWGENVNRVMGELKNEVEKKKSTKNLILYYPEELLINKNLIRITGGIPDLYEAYFVTSNNLSQDFEISNKSKVIKIACGGTHTLALTSTGDILSWGYGNCGQLGLGNEKRCAQTPTLINFGIDKKFVKIYCGYGHCMAIENDTHEVYTWGDGSKGQLGKGLGDSSEPSVVDELSGKDIIKGACGHDFSACVSSDGRIFIWGSNSNNKLGLDSNNLNEPFPKVIGILVTIKKISLGQNHAAAINVHGELFTWGHGYYGQLGHGDSQTIRLPKKVDLKDVKFRKVKCGSYQTVSICRKDYVYVSGRGLLNLSTESDKHKLKIEIIEDFKSSKGRTIQTGYGNTLVLTMEKELYGFGDNEFGKAGGDLQEKYVTKNPKIIKFETGGSSKNKFVIEKLFCAYHHCFALTDTGDIYGWGNPKNFRMTQLFGDNIVKQPKLVQIEWKSEKVAKKKDENNEEDGEKTNVDDKYIMYLIKGKKKNLTIKDIFFIMENLEKKYEDKKLNQLDNAFQFDLMSLMKNVVELNNISIKESYMSVVRLQVMRFRQLGAPKKDKVKEEIPSIIKNNINEIERVFTLFYLHPCYYLDLLDGASPDEVSDFICGIKFLYRDINKFNKKCESLDNMLFIASFRILVDMDFSNVRDFDNIFMDQNSFTELMLSLYFYNTFQRSILLDIFQKTLNDLNKYCSENSKLLTNSAVINTMKMLLENPEKIGERDMFKGEHIDQLVELAKSIVSDLESHISKIPIYVFYLIKQIKRKIKKELVSRKSDKKEFEKLKQTLFRLLFKNIISRLLKILGSENQDFLMKTLGYSEKSETKKRIETYLPLLGELFDRMILNLFIIIDKSQESELDPQVQEAVYLVNQVIKENHQKLYDIFLTKVLKVNFEFKIEIISSILYGNLDINVKKFQIDLGNLVRFLKVCNKKKNKLSIFFTNLNVLDMYENNGSLKSNYATFNPNQKIIFYVDIKYLLDPKKFVLKYSKALKLTAKDLKEFKIGKCKKCYVLMPQQFIQNEKYDEYIIKNFEQKVKNKSLLYVGEIFNHQTFEKEGLETLNQLYEALKNLFDILSKNKLPLFEECQMIIRKIEEELNKADNDANKLQNFLSELQKHVKKKLKHYIIMTKALKILNDLPDAKDSFRNKLININDDLYLTKCDLKDMKNSIKIAEEDEARKLIELTHNRKALTDYSKKDDNVFRYKMLDIPLNELYDKGIIVDYGLIHDEKENIILNLSANTTKKFFDLKLNQKKTKELLKSYSFNYDDYVYFYMYSNLFTVLEFEEFGKFNSILFYNMLHGQLNDS